MFISNSNLAEWIVEWRNSGLMPDELVEAVTVIAAGCGRRHGRGLDEAELIQRVMVVVLGLKDKLDVSQNLFGYFNQVAVSEIVKLRKAERRWERLKPLPEEGTMDFSHQR